METQVNNTLVIFGGFALLGALVLFQLLLESIRSGRTVIVQGSSMGMGQPSEQGWNFGPIALVAAIVVFGVLISPVLPTNEPPPDVPPQPSQARVAQAASPAHSNIAIRTLTDSFEWQFRALQTRDGTGNGRFLVGNARQELNTSLEELERNNCYWQLKVTPVNIVAVRNIQPTSFQASVNFDIVGKLYCNGRLVWELNPTRIGTIVDFVKVGERWLVSDSPDIRKLVGLIPMTQD